GMVVDQQQRRHALANQGKVHLLLAVAPLPRIETLYHVVFEKILNERVSTTPVVVAGRGSVCRLRLCERKAASGGIFPSMARVACRRTPAAPAGTRRIIAVRRCPSPLPQPTSPVAKIDATAPWRASTPPAHLRQAP